MSKPIFEMLEQRQFLSVTSFGSEIAESHFRSRAATFAGRTSVASEGHAGKRSGWHHDHSEQHSGEHRGHESEHEDDDDDSGSGTGGGGNTGGGGGTILANVAPSFTAGPNQTVVQDSGPMTVANWATNISAGPAGEAGQKLTFVTSTDNDALFATLPAISSDGTLTYASAPGVTGTANVTVTLKDNGGTANVGVDTSAAQSFKIDVTTGQVVVINQAPSFTKGANQSVPQDSGAHTVANWATNISAGPASEAGQSLTFLTSTNNDALFAVTPSVAPNGTLTYTPAAGATGSVTVTVKLRDNGGTANGGVDTSASQTFTINLTPVAPSIPSFVGTYNGMLVIPAVGHNKAAVMKIDAQSADGSFTGSLTSGSVTVVISGKMAANGSFSMNLDIPPGTPHSGGSLSGTGTGVIVTAGQPMKITLSFSGIPGTLTVTKA